MAGMTLEGCFVSSPVDGWFLKIGVALSPAARLPTDFVPDIAGGWIKRFPLLTHCRVYESWRLPCLVERLSPKATYNYYIESGDPFGTSLAIGHRELRSFATGPRLGVRLGTGPQQKLNRGSQNRGPPACDPSKPV